MIPLFQLDLEGSIYRVFK